MTTAADDILLLLFFVVLVVFFFLLFSEKIKSGVLCLADDSHEMLCFSLSKK